MLISWRDEAIKSKQDKRTRINRQIVAQSVRLIGAEGEQVGIVDIRDAMSKASESGLDLVEISPNAEPPVCRIMDYGKYLYEISKKKASQKRKTKNFQLKEIKLRPGTDVGDYTIKLNKAKQFVEAGHKVKMTVRFKGREIMHHELGMDMLHRLEHDLEPYAKVEQTPKQEGRQLFIIVGPK